MMKLNSDKSKFMVVNFTENYQFNTRLNIENEMLKQVSETRLLGVIVNEQITWHSNNDHIVKKAYTRMVLLHNLFDFGLPIISCGVAQFLNTIRWEEDFKRQP